MRFQIECNFNSDLHIETVGYSESNKMKGIDFVFNIAPLLQVMAWTVVLAQGRERQMKIQKTGQAANGNRKNEAFSLKLQQI